MEHFLFSTMFTFTEFKFYSCCASHFVFLILFLIKLITAKIKIVPIKPLTTFSETSGYSIILLITKLANMIPTTINF